jgi:hypothetical protein
MGRYNKQDKGYVRIVRAIHRQGLWEDGMVFDNVMRDVGPSSLEDSWDQKYRSSGHRLFDPTIQEEGESLSCDFRYGCPN